MSSDPQSENLPQGVELKNSSLKHALKTFMWVIVSVLVLGYLAVEYPTFTTRLSPLLLIVPLVFILRWAHRRMYRLEKQRHEAKEREYINIQTFPKP